MCLRGCVGISDLPAVVLNPSLSNLASSVQKNFVWKCWCSKGPRQNSARSTNQLFVRLYTLRRRGCRPALSGVHHTCIRLRLADLGIIRKFVVCSMQVRRTVFTSLLGEVRIFFKFSAYIAEKSRLLLLDC